MKISEDGTSLLYGNTEDKMDAKKGLQFGPMSHLYDSFVNPSKPTVYFIEDLEDVTHISEESFHWLYHFESSLASSSTNQRSIGKLPFYII